MPAGLNLFSAPRPVPVAKIGLEDSPYACSYPRLPPDGGRLAASLASTGMLNPPLLAPAGGGRWWCVAGVRRLICWRDSGQQEVHARTVLPGVTPEQLLLAGLDDNACSRVLNPVECGNWCRLIEEICHPSPEEWTARFLPRMGAPPSLRQLERLLAVPGLPGPVLALMAAGEFPLKNVHLLTRWDRPDQELLGEVMAAFRLGSNRQQQLLEMSWNLAKATGVKIKDLLQEAGALPLPGPVENLPQLAVQLLENLYRRRWPSLTRREELVRQIGSALRAAGEVRLHAAPFFEKFEYRIELVFRDPGSLRQILQKLAGGEGLTELPALFQPIEPPDQ